MMNTDSRATAEETTEATDATETALLFSKDFEKWSFPRTAVIRGFRGLRGSLQLTKPQNRNRRPLESEQSAIVFVEARIEGLTPPRVDHLGADQDRNAE